MSHVTHTADSCHTHMSQVTRAHDTESRRTSNTSHVTHRDVILCRIALHCDTRKEPQTLQQQPQHTATRCNTLQHTATHCTTLQHTYRNTSHVTHREVSRRVMSHLTHYNESCHTSKRVTSNIASHDESRHTSQRIMSKRVTSHLTTSHVKRQNESRQTLQRVMLHLPRSHAKHYNKSCHATPSQRVMTSKKKKLYRLAARHSSR